MQAHAGWHFGRVKLAFTCRLPNGLELSCPAEAGYSPLLYARPAGDSSSPERPARRVSFSELLGSVASSNDDPHAEFRELVEQLRVRDSDTTGRCRLADSRV
jgi:hypothetical protein